MNHVPGLEAQADWAGDKGHFLDCDTGELVEVHIFVMTLPYSGYFYCEGFLDEKMSSWYAGHTNAFNFFGGVRLEKPMNSLNFFLQTETLQYHKCAYVVPPTVIPTISGRCYGAGKPALSLLLCSEKKSLMGLADPFPETGETAPCYSQ